MLMISLLFVKNKKAVGDYSRRRIKRRSCAITEREAPKRVPRLCLSMRWNPSVTLPVAYMCLPAGKRRLPRNLESTWIHSSFKHSTNRAFTCSVISPTTIALSEGPTTFPSMSSAQTVVAQTCKHSPSR